ncbi:hypothetical protein K438DRAFT_698911 [Mycena galopus ATCC 62051]|nr:hypothetical protein K438DRAFT_698911 [Mycena galopus ATCC 62051]
MVKEAWWSMCAHRRLARILCLGLRGAGGGNVCESGWRAGFFLVPDVRVHKTSTKDTYPRPNAAVELSLVSTIVLDRSPVYASALLRLNLT